MLGSRAKIKLFGLLTQIAFVCITQKVQTKTIPKKKTEYSGLALR